MRVLNILAGIKKHINTFPTIMAEDIVKEYLYESRIFSKGYLLDVGCGKKPYKTIYEGIVSRYIGLNYLNRTDTFADILGDAYYLPFKGCSFDTVLNTQMLEHIEYPCKVLREFNRVLRKEGMLILTIPHICRIHGEPMDFYRFTGNGISSLLRDAGFELVYIKPMYGFWVMVGLMFNFYWIELGIRNDNIFKRILIYIGFAFSYLISWLWKYLDKLLYVETLTFNYIVVAVKKG